MPLRFANQKLKSLLSNAIAFCAIVLLCLVSSSGCRALRYDPTTPNLGGKPELQNPLIIPMVDRWLVMDQISDEMDDYFKIYREERIRVMDGVMSEGWIETHPKIGGTLLEPWQLDSTPGFERIHSTLQTTRRFAKVRVIPTSNAYQVDVKVFKELEDLSQPVGASVGGTLLRHDNSLDVDQDEPWISGRQPGWIPMGRDFSLEQKILRDIQQRFSLILQNGPPAGLQAPVALGQ